MDKEYRSHSLHLPCSPVVNNIQNGSGKKVREINQETILPKNIKFPENFVYTQ